MMKAEIEIRENTIVCKVVALEYSHTECDGRIYVTTKRVRKILIENGHNPGNVIEDSRVDNCNNKLSGVWVFEDIDQIRPTIEPNLVIEEKNSAPKQTKTTRKRNSRKSKKSLDNSRKDVIIEE